MAAPALVRLSALARFWEIHPRTIQAWIHQGRLVALRSPGNHFRLRVADIRAFCEREGMPVPPFVAVPAKRALIAAPSDPLLRSTARALKGNVTVELFLDPYAAMVATARQPVDVLAISAAFPRFDVVSAVRAIKTGPAALELGVVVFDVGTRTQATSLESAGATHALMRAREQELPRALREILGLELE